MMTIQQHIIIVHFKVFPFKSSSSQMYITILYKYIPFIHLFIFIYVVTIVAESQHFGSSPGTCQRPRAPRLAFDNVVVELFLKTSVILTFNQVQWIITIIIKFIQLTCSRFDILFWGGGTYRY